MNVLYENVPESILFIVMICGIAFIGMTCTLVIVTIKEIIADGIRKWKRNYKMRHRFDKPPTAKCYCIDCAWRWDNVRGICTGSVYTACKKTNCTKTDRHIDIEAVLAQIGE